MVRIGFILLSFSIFVPAAVGQESKRPDILIADFEGATYGDWIVHGDAFGKSPAQGTLPGQMQVDGFQGKGLVNSYVGGDDSVGTLTSPKLKLQRKHLNFLIGGGGWKDETCLQLKVDGKIVRTATGSNTHSGGSEKLDWASWDVAEFEGREAVIEIVDARKGGWGHINVDQITQSDVKKEVGKAKWTLVVAGRYLRLPSKRGAANNRLKVAADGKLLVDCDIQLAEDSKAQPFLVDLAASGKPPKAVEIEIERLGSDSPLLTGGWKWFTDDRNEQMDAARPRFHFAARRGWLNDPNGLVYHNGKYHLYFQHNPYGSEWGNMHWGHAVSSDLVSWEELPLAIKPPQHGDWAFSGSALVDTENLSGFGTKENPPIVAAWTSTGRGECISYSTDGGMTFKEYEGNPVVKHQGRDPRILWHAATKQWAMAVYDEFEGKQWIAFYSSPDLKKWTFQSRIEGYFECPELFPLKAGGSGEEKWILYAADGEYVVGQFDGKAFKPETKKQRLWYGNFYASQTYSNEPKGRRIQIGWARGIDPKFEVFNQQMNVPVELKLVKTKGDYQLRGLPVAEIGEHGVSRTKLPAVELEQAEKTLAEVGYNHADLEVEFARIEGEVDLQVFGNSIRLSSKEGTIECRGVKAPLDFEQSPIRVRALLDQDSIEVFANDGQIAIAAQRHWNGPGFLTPAVKLVAKGECHVSGGSIEEVLATLPRK